VAALTAFTSSLFVIPGCQAATCKVRSENLAERLWKSVFAGGAEKRSGTMGGPRQQQAWPQSAAPTPEAPKTMASLEPPVRPSRRSVAPRNFKESGSPTATVTCEVYTDYECPACARLYADVMPQLVAEYVTTGKVKLRHRDYPLAYHAHSRLAARYANAAGQVGHYEAAVLQIFRTQNAWGLTGDVDQQVAQVLSPEAMQKVRELVRNDARLDDTVAADVEMGRRDLLRQTPSMAIVSGGQRRVMPFTDYGALKNALDEALRGR
jgi:protein-disulfide isomerase